MTETGWDVVVIGGGIHGVGVAQAAAAAGYSVLLLERQQLATGTSSRSSKLIHGGLRYLQHGQFALVRECLRERKLLLKLAPQLVTLRPFFIPVYDDSSRGPWLVRAGLSLYALLGGLTRSARFRQLPRREWSQLDGLRRQGLRAVFQYWDGQSDDVALTRAVMASAQRLGAVLQTQAEFVAAQRDSQGYALVYRQGEQTRHCHASVLVNAAGPWVNQVLSRIQPAPASTDIDWVQGTHLVLEGRLARGIYYLQSPHDGRPLFAMPWHERDNNGAESEVILLGTTETRFQGDPGAVRPLPAEVDYLLQAFQHYFAQPSAEAPTVRRAFAGLRVLPVRGDDMSSTPRDTLLLADDPGRPQLLTVYGGKLTAYRATAEKVMAMLAASLPARKRRARTRRVPLSVDAET
jgi:glycerol-3-phosphate dehydrogenase